MNFAPDSQRNAIARAMHRQSHNQRDRDVRKMSRRILIEVARGASRTNVVNIFANQEKKQIARGGGNAKDPSAHKLERFRSKSEQGDAKQGAGSQANQRT